jgi:hypothetical protein
MAGDWIKMRGNLWDDPRVGRICDLCDAGEAAVVGALYWLWATADQHTEDGAMPGLSLRQIDRKTGVPGFAAALVVVGWLLDDPQGVVIVKFEEHNGASAKRRCGDAQRKANSRTVSATDADKSRTEPGHFADELGQVAELEKRREEKKEQHTEPSGSVPARKARGQRRCPETFDVSDEMREWARASAPSANVERETMKFRNHEFAKAHSDWLATWQNWILKADENAASSPQGRPPPESFRAQEHRIAAERVAETSPRIARRMNPNPTFDYVDMEIPDAPRLA